MVNVWYFVLQSIPISKPFFTKQLIVNYSIFELLNVFFLNPIPYQLWFIKDLLFLVFISPIIFWLLNYLNYFFVVFLIVCWLFRVDFFLFSAEAFLFFTSGAFLCNKNVNIEKKVNKKYCYFSLLSWITIVFINTSLNYVNLGSEFLLFVINKISILFGITAIWLLYDSLFEIVEISELKINIIFQYSFFIYASHEPMLTVYKKVLYAVLRANETSSFLIYLIAPILTILTSLLLGNILRKNMPRFYYLITGGR